MKSRIILFLITAVVLVGLHLFYSKLAYDSGTFFICQDDVNRTWYAMHYTETVEFSTFDYTWLPMPLINAGMLGEALNGQFYRAQTILNRFLCLLTVMLGFLAVFILRKNILAPAIAGVLAISAPWQSFAGWFALAEPHLWAGLMLTIFSLVCLSEADSLKKWYFFTTLGVIGTVYACLSRYEAWPFAPGFVAGLLLILCNLAIKSDREDREKLIVFRLPGILLAAGLVLWPIAWWLSIHAEVNGDWLRPFRETHMFVRDGVGQVNQTFTAVDLFSDSNPYCIWLPIFALISLCKRKWTLGYFFLTVPILLHLSSLVYFTFKGGIGWVFGYRVIAFHSIALAFPAGIVLEEWLRSKPDQEDDPWYSHPMPFIAGGLILVIVGSYTHFTRIPIEGKWEKQKDTRDYLLQLQEEQGLESGFRVAIIPEDKIFDAWAMIEHKNYELVTMPQEVYNQIFERNFPAVKDWMIKNRITFFLSNHRIKDPAELQYIEICRTVETRINFIRQRNDAFVIMTHKQAFNPLPSSAYELLKDRGLSGPAIIDQPVRYRALAPPMASDIAATEMTQLNPQENPQDLFIRIHESPENQRNNWPGQYPIKILPSDFDIASVLQIGDAIVHPRYPGYYVLSFDFETGKQTDFFFIGHDNIHTDDWSKIHFPVYGISKD